MTDFSVTFEPKTFDELPRWRDDNHLAAFQAFQNSSHKLADAAARGTGYLGTPSSAGLLATARRALLDPTQPADREQARAFFETHFVPHRVVQQTGEGLLTGYYEPILEGARSPDATYTIPLLRRPKDLVNLVSEADRGKFGDQLTHGRQTEHGIEPFPTRAEIETGALAGQTLEFIWLKDAVDAFFLHVEGSGVVRFDTGNSTRVTYDGKNGHPYTSIGQYLIEQGHFRSEEMTFEALRAWLKADFNRAREVMQQNQSFIFFRELTAADPDCALGVLQIPLSAHRSLAVDTSFHEIGVPIYVVAPNMEHVDQDLGLNRLMIAQDVGSAIRGPERGDVFFGSGVEAGRQAGLTLHQGAFYVLKPRDSENQV
ncbi:MAG: MltA domain-containing protein [Alphaproteobacteria bacterium]|nr:MltA domain-containing protein [Alphaproteobacteria bacterium]